LVWTAPVGWDDLRAPRSLKEAIALGGRQTFAGIVSSASFMPFRGRRGVRVVLQDASDAACKLHAFWFFSAHGVLAMAKPGAALLGIGKITVEPKKPPRTAHPDLFVDGPEARVARPRYPRLGPKGALLRKAIAVAAPAVSPAPDPVPAAIAAREQLPPVNTVICNMHAIGGALPTPADQTAFVSRLAWAEAFTRAWERFEVEEGLARTPAPVLPAAPRLVGRLEKELGFSLTKDQRAAAAVIAEDLASPKPMRRLLLGDVGTGKTAVALAAVGQAVLAGKQAAILAPTSVLAEQYVAAVRPLERAVKTRAVLVAAGAPARGASEKALASGEARIVIGTHAVLGSSVTLPELGLVVVDEQQRLGVAQRLSLVRKGPRPHLLTLSATPIPRTLALALRGELATTTLRERPAGRKPVSTTMLPKTALRAVVKLVEEAVTRG
jgi:ATP-dependent DNA helicase RecG